MWDKKYLNWDILQNIKENHFLCQVINKAFVLVLIIISSL